MIKSLHSVVFMGLTVLSCLLSAEENGSESLMSQDLVTKEFSLESIAFPEQTLPAEVNFELPDTGPELTAEVDEIGDARKEFWSPMSQLESEMPFVAVENKDSMPQLLPLEKQAIEIDLQRAFAGSPVIYSILLGMSVFSLCIWLYSLTAMRSHIPTSNAVMKMLEHKLTNNHFEEALLLCNDSNSLLCKMVASGIRARKFGLSSMAEAIKAEGKRSSIAFWQKIGMLSEVAIIAPMLGLLGTVLGMFYAFYDLNRSMESISSLFDGLGISVGTTVAGLIVAILALILHFSAKYRLIKALAVVEQQAQSMAVLIDDRTSIHT